MKKYLAIFSVVLAGLAFIACESPTPIEPPEKNTGSLTITLHNSVSRAMLPDQNMDTSYYLVEGSGPSGESFSENTSSSITREDLAAGEWTITVTAFNAADTAIGSGSAAINVGKNSTAEVNITVSSYNGFGTLDLTVSWVEGALDDPDIEASLKLSDGTSRDLNFIIEGSQASFSASDIPTGFHTLIIELVNGWPKEDITGAVELVRIAEGAVTTGNITFDKLNIDSGSIQVGITPEIGDPLVVSILGAEDTKPENTSLTLSAEVSNYTGNLVYIWYVNAHAVETGENFTLDESWTQDFYRIDLIACTADGSRGGSTSVNVEVLPQVIDPDSFISVWDMSLTDTNTLTIPLVPEGNYDFTIDWGDGFIETYRDSEVSHSYDIAAQYKVTVTGLCEGFGYSSESLEGNEKNLIDIEQWGNIKLNNQPYKFAGCSNLAHFSASDTPDLSGISNLSNMFFKTDTFNGDISNWDVSSVTDMSGMFSEALVFNQDISSWNTSNVLDMSNMFDGGIFEETLFNQDLTDWDVSSVSNMKMMFRSATSFNGNISNWDVSSVTDMKEMFYYAKTFNQDLSSWNVSSVESMSRLFCAAYSFNQDISTWDVSSVYSMFYMFNSAYTFNQNISSWDVSSVSGMTGMFEDAYNFNQNISSWDVSGVRYMDSMFERAYNFNQDISSWDTSKVWDMGYMFFNADSFNQDISGWDVSSVRDMSCMFYDEDAFNQDLSGWNVSSVRDMSMMFYDADAFDQDLSTWNVSSVTDMKRMFHLANSFSNGGNPSGLETWAIENVTDMTQMFYLSSLSPLPSWYPPQDIY